ncbi:aspartyl/glutamyl-tRNA(Asn/Gln) amidotransferase subunit C [Candidatus Profftella armatura (Diaphorina cf. continua)]|uniref:Glutamyl-tRNA(Gln) amidotransferase subunit C n=1 Tax=Candidatus Profftella armatura (Diaphorina cf. continua) TaxID=2661583 RepID=A0A7R6W0J8_9PROT|nr:Asp-tRNA(Asn)/Glu-tRNA(Gln) amidotransferase subunit GatC [Candidatus Profftella armatura (Diaphorina cf. continua)]BCG49632.1 aspartyl/glutamyl-tRNA(Asn/Gln) amidotransferase subunit C [Candidatus Profftella armatura (Diaphorina cf. continua)]
MSLTLLDIESIANLSYLAIDKNQIYDILKKINDIFSLIKSIKNIDTTNIEPLYYPISLIQEKILFLRKDITIKNNNYFKNYQNLAPIIHDSLYIVPKIF